jgi:dolichol-phosphate mannosyltransferase
MVPLRIATYTGALLTTVLTFVGIAAVIGWILSGTVPGWTSLTLLVVMISSVQLLVLGLIGEYVGRIYIQSKHRPLFLISHIHRRARLPGSYPHDPAGSDPADSRDDIEKVQFKTLLAHSGPDKRSQVFDEISR